MLAREKSVGCDDGNTSLLLSGLKINHTIRLSVAYIITNDQPTRSSVDLCAQGSSTR